MESYSLMQKFTILMNMIASSPLFLFCSMVGISVLIFFLMNIKKNKNANKYIFLLIWLVLIVLLLINYSNIFFGMIDNVFDNIFYAIYFPNLTVYIVILCIINTSFFYSIFSKKIESSNKILNFICTLIINIILVAIVDIVNKNGINVYEPLTVYSNSNLLVLLEITTSIFISWILLTLLISAHRKLKKYDNSGLKKPDIVFEDI